MNRESPTELVAEALSLLEKALGRLRANTRYNKSEKRSQVAKRYGRSEKGKARDRRYSLSPARKAAWTRYNTSFHGRLIQAMNNQRPGRKLSKLLHKQEQRLGKRPHIF